MLLVGAGSGGPRAAVAGCFATVVFGLCIRIQWSVAVAAVRSGAAGACGGLGLCSVPLRSRTRTHSVSRASAAVGCDTIADPSRPAASCVSASRRYSNHEIITRRPHGRPTVRAPGPGRKCKTYSDVRTHSAVLPYGTRACRRWGGSCRRRRYDNPSVSLRRARPDVRGAMRAGRRDR